MKNKISQWEELIMNEAAKVGNDFDNNESLDCGSHAEAFGMGAGFATKMIFEWMEAFCCRGEGDAGDKLTSWELFEAFQDYIRR